MATYVALLRGIGPINPNMHPKKLKSFFESLGFKNVSPVIASGNLVFQSPSKNSHAIERKIETALPKRLGFKSTTIIRSKEYLEKIVAKNPYKKLQDDSHYYLLVTFLKHHHSRLRTFPRKGKGFGVVGVTKQELFGYLDRKQGGHSPDFMRTLEKEFGKEITSRTWQTVKRILTRMNAS
jgi:uncharacterized protein (DUF1697 family)